MDIFKTIRVFHVYQHRSDSLFYEHGLLDQPTTTTY